MLLNIKGHTQFFDGPSKCWLNKFRKTQQLLRKSIRGYKFEYLDIAQLAGRGVKKNISVSRLTYFREKRLRIFFLYKILI